METDRENPLPIEGAAPRWRVLLRPGVIRTSLYGLLGGIGLFLAIGLQDREIPTRWDQGVHLPLTLPHSEHGQVRYTIDSGENVASILSRFGAPVEPVLDAARSVRPLERIRAGHCLTFDYTQGVAHAVRVTYEVDDDTSLEVAATEGAWTARILEAPQERRPLERVFSVRSSLWEASLRAGLRPADIVRIAEIFQWEVDFNTEIQQGASISLIGDALYRGDKLLRLSTIHAISLDNAGKKLVSIRHAHPDGSEDYYSPDGTSHRRMFLRSPLPFSKVSSGFSRSRFHPILKTRRPHWGTDFVAPTGTPVRAIADGVVTVAGTRSGHGQRIELRHSSNYASGYSHLSRVQVRTGQKVRQGDIIGAVGSTGLSTGPHLHFDIAQKGRYIDPNRTSLPASEPVPSGERPSFEATCARWLPALLALGETRSAELPLLADAEESDDSGPFVGPSTPDPPKDAAIP